MGERDGPDSEHNLDKWELTTKKKGGESVDGKLLKETSMQGGLRVVLAKLMEQDSCWNKPGYPDITRGDGGRRGTRPVIERDQTSNLKGKGFWLKWLSRVIAKTGFYKEVYRWAQEMVQEPD